MTAGPMTADETAPRLDIVETLHGHVVADPYRWLEDPQDERTVCWSSAQDARFAEHSRGWTRRPAVARRVERLMGCGVVGVPAWRDGRCFLMRRTAEQEHAVLLVVDPEASQPSGPASTLRAEPERAEPAGETILARARVLLDPVALDPSGATTLDSWQPSKDGALLAYQLSVGGREESVLQVLDVTTGRDVESPIDRARYSPVAWLSPDHPLSPAFYYVRRLDPAGLPADERQYHRRVWLHRLGTDPADDVLVFGEGRPMTSYYGVTVSRDGRWLTVSASEGTAPRTDVWIADLQASDPAAPRWREVAVGLDAQVHAHVARDGRLMIFTDYRASRGRLAVTSPADPGPQTWTDLLAEDPEAVLADVAVLDEPDTPGTGVLLAARSRHAVSEISVHDLGDGRRLPGAAGSVPLPGLGSVGALVELPQGGHECWFGYSDVTTPQHIYRYDARVHAVRLWARPPGDVQVPRVVSRQLSFPSADGTSVRMLVTSRADLLQRGPDGTGTTQVPMPRAPAPTVLYGYGGFGVSLDPQFSPAALAWVEAGGTWVTASLRGGGEEGEAWHRAGMLADKHHTFEDFHAAADALVAGGWTTPDRLCIYGGSNGGLLVGVALTQRPQAYRTVVCSAPLLDMVRYERFGLGATWSSEYGTAADPEQLGWLLSYSPVHHVRRGEAYPAVLFTVFDGDTRVDPMHARKLCAALQWATSSDRPVLLRREGDVGHGARAVSRTISLVSDVLCFAAEQTGLQLPGRSG